MIDSRKIFYFALRFVVCFGLLALPWWNFQASFAARYQPGARELLSLVFPYWQIDVEPCHEPEHPSVDTKISIGDPQERRPDGTLPMKVIITDSRSLGWMPIAMFVALWGATPLKWGQRLKVLAAGLGGTLLFIAVTILASVWPVMVGESGWQSILAMVSYHLLVDNLWVSFVGPALIWLVSVLWFWPGNHPCHSERRIPMPGHVSGHQTESEHPICQRKAGGGDWKND
jgi:hypothetical protein